MLNEASKNKDARVATDKWESCVESRVDYILFDLVLEITDVLSIMAKEFWLISSLNSFQNYFISMIIKVILSLVENIQKNQIEN
jgi:hypothetical protein